jgi:hypothetical protein
MGEIQVPDAHAALGDTPLTGARSAMHVNTIADDMAKSGASKFETRGAVAELLGRLVCTLDSKEFAQTAALLQ